MNTRFLSLIDPGMMIVMTSEILNNFVPYSLSFVLFHMALTSAYAGHVVPQSTMKKEQGEPLPSMTEDTG